MAKVKFKWNLSGFRELRTDPKVARDLRRRADSIAARAGSGYEVGEQQSPRNRAHNTIYTATPEAMLKEQTTHDLLLALGAESGQKMNLYTTKSGKVRLASDAQVANWTRGR